MQWKKRPGSFGIYDQSLPADPGSPGVLIAAVSQAHPTAEANARLIAAAPQLLEALRSACLSMTAIRFGAKDCYETAMAECRSAIAAATGPDIAAETERAAAARRNEECQTNNATPSA